MNTCSITLAEKVEMKGTTHHYTGPKRIRTGWNFPLRKERKGVKQETERERETKIREKEAPRGPHIELFLVFERDKLSRDARLS